VVCPIDAAKRRSLLTKGTQQSLQPDSVAVPPGSELEAAGWGGRAEYYRARSPGPHGRCHFGDTYAGSR
jgi:hypothetical protein